MRTPASIAGHPIHAMLVTFPVGLWIFSLVCDLLGLRSATPEVWQTVSLYAMVGGIIGALAAAVPGFIDLLYYQGGKPPVKKIALTHMTINLVAVVLFLINAWLRMGGASVQGTPLTLSFIGVALIFVSGWLGGQMVHIHGVGVEQRE